MLSQSAHRAVVTATVPAAHRAVPSAPRLGKPLSCGMQQRHAQHPTASHRIPPLQRRREGRAPSSRLAWQRNETATALHSSERKLCNGLPACVAVSFMLMRLD